MEFIKGQSVVIKCHAPSPPCWTWGRPTVQAAFYAPVIISRFLWENLENRHLLSGIF